MGEEGKGWHVRLLLLVMVEGLCINLHCDDVSVQLVMDEERIFVCLIHKKLA